MDDYTGHYQNRTFGNYHLSKLLGEGGFSEVYLGEHRYLKNEAAIKVLRTRLTDDEFERFRQEAQTIIGMGHPNMVRVLEFGVQDHIPFIVMNYAPNGSLGDLYPDGTRVPLERIVQLVQQVAAALQYAHDHQVIHRDIKPDNLLIGPDGEVLLSDFGIAVTAHNTYSQKTQEAIGTVAYMAPEQLRRKARTASDQYALAVMVYEWLCGELPFQGAPIEVALQHLNDPPPSLSTSVPDIPHAVEEVVLKALAKDPSARFPSVQAFADALEAAANGDAISLDASFEQALVPSSVKMNEQKDAESIQEDRETVTASRRRHSTTFGRVMFLGSLACIVVIASLGVMLMFAFSRSGIVRELPTPVAPKPFIRPSPFPTKALPTSAPTQVPTSKPLPSPAAPALLLSMPTAVVSVAWSPGGSFYAIADISGDVGVWQLHNKQQWEVSLGVRIWSIAWSPDSPDVQRLAVASDDGKVRIFDALSGKLLTLYTGHGNVSVLSVAWSKDYSSGVLGVVSGDADGVMHVWDPVTGQTRVTMHQVAPVTGLASSYSSIISVGAPPGGIVYMWDTTSGQGGAQFTNNNDNIPYGNDKQSLVEGTLISAAWSSDATYIALGDTNGNVWLLSDTNCSCWLFETGFNADQERVNSISWSSDNKTFATASDDGNVQTWMGSDGSHVQTYPDPYKSKDLTVAWSPDGQTLLTGDNAGHVLLWQVA